MSKVAQIYTAISSYFKSNPQAERKVQAEVGRMVTQVYQHALASSDGFCYKFSLPIVDVMGLFREVNLKDTDVEEAFRADWGYPNAKTKMYADKMCLV